MFWMGKWNLHKRLVLPVGIDVLWNSTSARSSSLQTRTRNSVLNSSSNNLFKCKPKILSKDISGAPTRVKRAWDRAPYSWNMVNLFSFGSHVIDRAYVRTYVRVYRLYGWGRGGYQKEGRGVPGVSWQVHIFNIGHWQYGQLTAVKTG